MNIVIAGGTSEADYLIRSLVGKGHRIIAINDDPDYCAYLAQSHRIPVISGDPCKLYVLDEAEIEGFDLMIALLPSDADNLAICQSAKRIYHIAKTVAIVSNPKNVDVFKKLGVNTAISATYLIATYIEQASTVENLVSSLAVEHGQIVLTELLVSPSWPVCGKRIVDIPFAKDAIISCIVRGVDMVVPRGQTEIRANDKLIILSTPEQQNDVIRSVMGEEVHDEG